jgi:SAM-dependent methyltransferase
LITASGTPQFAAARAFDLLAEEYDTKFTQTIVGRAQRDAVWNVLDRSFHIGQRILELNCGTGEDAQHLAERGIRIVACDASSRMIEVARRRLAHANACGNATFHHVPTERISEMGYLGPYQGAFSNFSGLNCVSDLCNVADQLAALLQRDAWLFLCVSTRFCLWESCWYTLRGDWKKASRRWNGRAHVCLGGVEVEVHYPTVSTMDEAFRPWFDLQFCTGIGVTIPPSYVNAWIGERPSLFRALSSIDGVVREWPLARVLGDHVLLAFRRSEL